MKRTALQGLDACALREANTLRLLELVVDEYGQDEGERGREGGGGGEKEGEFRKEVAENAALGMLLYLSNAVPSYASGKRGTSCSLLFLPFSATALQGYAGTVQHTARSASVNSHVLPT